MPAMRWGILVSAMVLTCGPVAFGQCAPGPDSSYFFRDLTQRRASAMKPALAVRNFSLLEHRKGFVVASYELVKGGRGRWFRDVYRVEAGKWRLASSKVAPLARHQAGGT
jgi:hypothetical protein